MFILFASGVFFSVTFLFLAAGLHYFLNVHVMKVVMMNRKQEQKLCKFTGVIFVVDTLEKCIVFSCLDNSVFSVY